MFGRIYTVYFNKESGEPARDFRSRLSAVRYAVKRIRKGYADSYSLEKGREKEGPRIKTIADGIAVYRA